jgi:hypothetical protein
MHRFAALFAALLYCSPVLAQQVQQSGTITPGHAACFTTNGVIQDCGSATASFLTSLGVAGQGQQLCTASGPLSGAANQICFSTTPTALSLNFNNLNGATGNAQVCINGTCTGLVSLNSIKVGVRSTNTNTTLSLTNDYFLCLDPTSNTIAVSLPASPPTGQTFLVKDCTGQAAVHAITVTPAAGNIDGSSNYVLTVPYQSIGLTYTGVQWSLN